MVGSSGGSNFALRRRRHKVQTKALIKFLLIDRTGSVSLGSELSSKRNKVLPADQSVLIMPRLCLAAVLVELLLCHCGSAKKDPGSHLYNSTCDRNTNWNYRNVSGTIKEWLLSIKVVSL